MCLAGLACGAGQGFSALLSQLNSALHPLPQAPDGLVGAHVPD